MRILNAYILASLCFFSAFASGEINPVAFHEAFIADRQGKPPASESVRNTGYILVPGLVSSLIRPFYYRHLAKGIREASGDQTPILKIRTPSDRSNLQNNIDVMKAQIDAFKIENPGLRWRVLTHSLGGIDFWGYLHQNPEFAEAKDFAIYAQVPWEGSELVSGLLSKDSRLRDVFSPKKYPIRFSIGWILLQTFGRYVGPVHILHPDVMTEHVEQVRLSNPDLLPQIMDKQLWIGTHRPPRDPKIPTHLIADAMMGFCSRALSNISGKLNDGLVTIKSQHPSYTRQRQLHYPGYHHGGFSHTAGGRNLGRTMTRDLR